MSRNDQTTAVGDNSTGQGKREGIDRRMFVTAEEARAAGPVLASQTLFQVVEADGTTTYTWARHISQAVMTLALARGWKAAAVGADPRSKAAALLATLSPEDRAALVAQFGTGSGKKAK
jgi:hypothetical protein